MTPLPQTPIPMPRRLTNQMPHRSTHIVPDWDATMRGKAFRGTQSPGPLDHHRIHTYRTVSLVGAVRSSCET